MENGNDILCLNQGSGLHSVRCGQCYINDPNTAKRWFYVPEYME